MSLSDMLRETINRAPCGSYGTGGPWERRYANKSEGPLQIFCCQAPGGGNLIRWSGRHDAASFVFSARADIYNPITLRCNRHIVLDQNDASTRSCS